MSTASKVQITIFALVAIMNAVFIFTGPNRMLHLNITLAFIGWAMSIYTVNIWRTRALKAEARR